LLWLIFSWQKNSTIQPPSAAIRATTPLNDRVSGFELVTKMTGLQKLSIANATKAQRMSLHKIPASLVELKF
jgi:hypothetical protein